MKFRHPSPSAVSVTHGDALYEVEDGVIDCPAELGAAHGWKAVPNGADPANGPTFEEYVGRGYRPENYPPQGYDEKPSGGLTAFRAEQQAAAARVETLKAAVPDVQAYVAALASGDELLELQKAEVSGKNRKGVVEAIVARLEQLTAPPPADAK